MNLYKSILPVDEKGFYGEFGGSFVPPELIFVMLMTPNSRKNSMTF